jgi:asparagine synthase (glutamine-hydrolysing)
MNDRQSTLEAGNLLEFSVRGRRFGERTMRSVETASSTLIRRRSFRHPSTEVSLLCGIAGVIDLRGERRIDRRVVASMARAIEHRGPDQDGFLFDAGLGFANRRLSIVGLADGRQPISNEDGSISVVFNGELFDLPEKRAWLEAKGHRFKTSCDTELFVHLYEEFGDDMFAHLKGQFGFALWDSRRRRILIGRDRLGICPMFFARRDDQLYFGSEIKAILASGRVRPEPDPLGVNHVFTFFAMGTRRTAFHQIHSLRPGWRLAIDFTFDGSIAEVDERPYWDLDFANQGEEENGSEREIVDRFEALLRRAVEIRLRADVPVVAYLSGGVDSTSVAVLSSQLRREPLTSFTIRIPTPELDETARAMMAAKVVGTDPHVVTCDGKTIAEAYPELVWAAESPVVDTSCAALFCLAREVRRRGFKVAITGEGGDEALAGYPWFKTNRLLTALDRGEFRPSRLIRKTYAKLFAPQVPWSRVEKTMTHMGGQHAIMDLYGLVGASRYRLFSKEMFDRLGDHVPYDDVEMPLERMKKWHPLNKSLYLGYKLMLPGLLLNHKGDRPAMGNSVETRYPFLDEDLVEFCSRIHPNWKLRGIRRDKHLLRLTASRILPAEIADLSGSVCQHILRAAARICRSIVERRVDPKNRILRLRLGQRGSAKLPKPSSRVGTATVVGNGADRRNGDPNVASPILRRRAVRTSRSRRRRFGERRAD